VASLRCPQPRAAGAVRGGAATTIGRTSPRTSGSAQVEQSGGFGDPGAVAGRDLGVAPAGSLSQLLT
jgi:hypothetical protein